MIFISTSTGGSSNGLEIGDVLMTTRKNLGEQWLSCDGSIVDQSAYPELWDQLLAEHRTINKTKTTKSTVFTGAYTSNRVHADATSWNESGTDYIGIVSLSRDSSYNNHKIYFSVYNCATNEFIITQEHQGTGLPSTFYLQMVYHIDGYLCAIVASSGASVNAPTLIRMNVATGEIDTTLYQFNVPQNAYGSATGRTDFLYGKVFDDELYICTSDSTYKYIKVYKGNFDYSSYEEIYSLNMPDANGPITYWQFDITEAGLMLISGRYLTTTANRYSYFALRVDDLVSETPLQLIFTRTENEGNAYNRLATNGKIVIWFTGMTTPAALKRADILNLDGSEIGTLYFNDDLDETGEGNPDSYSFKVTYNVATDCITATIWKSVNYNGTGVVNDYVKLALAGSNMPVTTRAWTEVTKSNTFYGGSRYPYKVLLSVGSDFYIAGQDTSVVETTSPVTTTITQQVVKYSPEVNVSLPVLSQDNYAYHYIKAK